MTKTIEVTVCDRCEEQADGFHVDCVYHLKCGHDICSNCKNHLSKLHPTVKFPFQWCPVCNQVVKGPYAV